MPHLRREVAGSSLADTNLLRSEVCTLIVTHLKTKYFLRNILGWIFKCKKSRRWFVFVLVLAYSVWKRALINHNYEHRSLRLSMVDCDSIKTYNQTKHRMNFPAHIKDLFSTPCLVHFVGKNHIFVLNGGSPRRVSHVLSVPIFD